MKRIVPTSIIIGITLLFGTGAIAQAVIGTPQPESQMDYSAYADALDLIEIIDGDDLTVEEVESRNGKLIIERVIGVVDDAETGDGHTLKEDPNCDYICYKRVPGISAGNVVCTYLVYNPDTNYCDDIIMRFDYIIDSYVIEN